MNLRTLSISEAVAATGISRDTLYVLCETGQVKANRNSLSRKSRWRISEASLQAWIEQRTPPAPPASPSKDRTFRERFPEAPEERVFG